MWFREDLNKLIKENNLKTISKKNLELYFFWEYLNIERIINYHNIPILKNWLYLLDEDIDQYEISYEIDRESYISLDTALYEYWLIPEIVRPIYAITTKKTNSFSNKKWYFSYKHIKDEYFFWYKFKDDFSYRIAEKEKAILDYFYFSKIRITENIISSVNKWNFETESIINIINWFKEERFQNLDNLSSVKLLKYSRRMNKKTLALAKIFVHYKKNIY